MQLSLEALALQHCVDWARQHAPWRRYLRDSWPRNGGVCSRIAPRQRRCGSLGALHKISASCLLLCCSSRSSHVAGPTALLIKHLVQNPRVTAFLHSITFALFNVKPLRCLLKLCLSSVAIAASFLHKKKKPQNAICHATRVRTRRVHAQRAGAHLTAHTPENVQFAPLANALIIRQSHSRCQQLHHISTQKQRSRCVPAACAPLSRYYVPQLGAGSRTQRHACRAPPPLHAPSSTAAVGTRLCALPITCIPPPMVRVSLTKRSDTLPLPATTKHAATPLVSKPPKHLVFAHQPHVAFSDRLRTSTASNAATKSTTMLTARVTSAFALAPAPLRLSRNAFRAAAPPFPQWKPTPWRPFSNFRPFPRTPSLSTSPKPQRAGSGNNGPAKGNGPADFGEGELFASSPELEQLAIKSSDAPILTRIVSYNVLSSSLAAASHFPQCDAANLDANTRLKRLLIKLEAPVASRSIICLQEVSLAWSGPLHTFFANRGFHLLLASHGSYFNGYMGEGLAFPLDLYEAVDLHIERLTDFIRWPQAPKLVGVPGVFSEMRSRLVKAIQALAGSPKPSRFAKREPWAHARARHNRFIFARLRSRTNGAKICVGTYHMPCIFWSPPVMMIHSALVVSRFQKLCGDDYGVLAGDFNIKPTDESYAMILRGTVDEQHRDFPPNAPDGSPASSWFPKLLAPMKSAYREVLGDEPDFTNYAKVENQPMFIETLDYLFCTSDVDVVDVIRLPNRDAVQGPYPDATESSDHVMIGATLRLPAPSQQAERKKAGVGASAYQDAS